MKVRTHFSARSTQTTESRRRFLRTATALGIGAVGWRLLPAWAQPAGASASPLRVTESGVDLIVDRTPIRFNGRETTAVTINGSVPGPLLRFREGDMATLRVTNRLKEDTSVHWHGLLLPQEMDGVPGLSFPGIKPGETFTYRFRVRQNGTYWYHSHSAMQEQLGHYGPIIIDPARPDPVKYDREHVILLSDWTYENPHHVMARLKKQSDYYNFQQRTVGDFFRDAKKNGLRATLSERLAWGSMRMSPADILDVTGYTYTYLMNGLAAADNWTALFRPGERVRLRFINGSASTFFNVRIPGLEMTVVQADGQNVQPVKVDEFQIAVAETYDVVVAPKDDQAYTIFAESMDRSGYVRGTFAPRLGMSAAVPALRERPLRTMADMGMDHSASGHGEAAGGGRTDAPTAPSNSVDHSAHGSGSSSSQEHDHHMQHKAAPSGDHQTHETKTSDATDPHAGHAMGGTSPTGPIVAKHGPDTHGPGNAAVAEVQRNRLSEPGTGLADVGHRVLVYSDLKSLAPNKDRRAPTREIELHLTGNMETFMWGFDGKKFSEAPDPIQLKYGERVRITLVNDTMMEHPMHLHGMFVEIDTGAGAHNPLKHTISVKPAERLSFDLTADEPGNWAFHCHFLYHMDMGMFRFVNIPMPKKGVRA